MHVELRTRSLPSDSVEGEYVDYVTLTAYEELRRDLIAANKDIRELRKNGTVLDAEISDQKRVYQGFQDMKEELDSVAVFLRENYQEEIKMGQHGGFKNVSQAAMFYMGKERLLSKKVEELEKKLEKAQGTQKGGWFRG